MSKTEDDFYEYLASITDEIITHELAIRNVDANKGPVVNRRKQLARELFGEQTNSNIQYTTVITPLNDLKVCRSMLERYERELGDPTSTSEIRRKAIANLEFIEKRIKRVECTSDEETDLAKVLLEAIPILTSTAQGGATKKTHSTPNTVPPQSQNANDHSKSNADDIQQQHSNKSDNSNSTSEQNPQHYEALARIFSEFRNLSTN